MSDYIIANGELYHYGVKGMKWGQRRLAKKLNKSGREAGAAKALKELADSNKKEWDKDVARMRKRANKYEREGKYIRADLARRKADRMQTTEDNMVSKYREHAAKHAEKAKRAMEKADKYKRKKQISLGKNKVSEIMKEARADGYKSEGSRERAKIAESNEAYKERQRQQIIDGAYFIRDFFRD